ncbi:MAG: DUF4082 domain-containing protein, partial [Ferruginibacter sp.]
MKKIVGLFSMPAKKIIFSILGIYLLSISCKKEQSAVAPPPKASVSIFTTQIPAGPTVNDSTGGIELGLKFQSSVAGYADGIRFYKTSGNSGTHTGQLYSSDGTLLASAVFTNETDSGWQRVLFATAIPIAANTTYIAAYFSSLGNYTSTVFGLKTAIINPPLTALADSTDGINGLYKYANIPALPDGG